MVAPTQASPTGASRVAHARHALREAVAASRERLVDLCQALVRINSQNPPGDTEAIADFITSWIGERQGLDITRVVSRPPVHNLIVSVRNSTQGRRLVFNGHLDTFTIGDAARWTFRLWAGSCATAGYSAAVFPT